MKATINKHGVDSMPRNYIDKISMPVLEWICVAAIPLYLCNTITVRWRTETLQSTTHDDDNMFLQSILSNISQSILVILGVTALLSIIAIFGMTNKSNNQKQQLRGNGFVIGSHLIPIMYFALLLLYCQNADTLQYTNSGLQHVMYSSCGGLAFIVSYIWLQRKGNENVTSENHAAVMQLCWKVYLVLLLCYQVYREFTRGFPSCMLFGIIHISMIGCYSTAVLNTRLDDQKQWQNAFTCGEWMVVSNLTASVIGDFMLHHYYSSLYDDYPDRFSAHARIAQAGLVGCFVGVAYCQVTSRILHQGIIGSLAGVVGIVIGFLEMTLGLPSTSQNNNWMPLIPRSIQWLLKFLSNEVRVEIGGSVVHFQRYAILGYWGLVLIASTPLTMKLCKWVEADEAMKKRRVVLARKFFHFVAVILFTPITWIDSDMMALSYAIATTLLMILEIVRCYSFGEEHGSISLSLNSFYTIFLDEKDSLAADGGLAITHITLIVGCAMPLWVTQIVNVTDESNLLVHLLPFVGVLVLGIGDSAGAIAGIKFGSHPWPGGSSRTLEGSLCMFVSMFALLYFVGFDDLFKVGTVLAIVTLFEASTSQIDNLCLPLAGTSLVVLFAA